jgi:hypothetical protein
MPPVGRIGVDHLPAHLRHDCVVKQHQHLPSGRLPAGGDVMLVGLFSGKDAEIEEEFDRLAAVVEAHGGRIAGRFVQRRGVSRGGAARMSTPFLGGRC